ncbi:ATPase [bacterium]|nr:ATPase [bacterium]
MSDKNCVSVEQKVCEVCGKPYDTNAILLHKQLRNTLDRTTITGVGICPEHKKLADEGYVFLIEVSNHIDDGTLHHSEADRTGEVIMLKRHVFSVLFNTDIPTSQSGCYVEVGVIEDIKALFEQARAREDAEASE